jgi:hypothetical protein
MPPPVKIIAEQKMHYLMTAYLTHDMYLFMTYLIAGLKWLTPHRLEAGVAVVVVAAAAVVFWFVRRRQSRV